MEDEILEVNRKNVQNITHAEIVMLIHRCKKSITLKVRRYLPPPYEYGELWVIMFRVLQNIPCNMVGQMQMKYERKANKIAGNSGSEQNIALTLFIPRSIGLEIFFSEY